MRRSHKVDVISSLLLQLQIDFRKMLRRNDPTGFPDRNIMILTENTTQIASGEKHSAGTGRTGDAGLLPIMKGCSGGHDICRLSAIAGLSLQAVDMAGSGTQSTIFHKMRRPYGSMGERTSGVRYYAVGNRNRGCDID